MMLSIFSNAICQVDICFSPDLLYLWTFSRSFSEWRALAKLNLSEEMIWDMGQADQDGAEFTNRGFQVCLVSHQVLERLILNF